MPLSAPRGAGISAAVGGAGSFASAVGEGKTRGTAPVEAQAEVSARIAMPASNRQQLLAGAPVTVDAPCTPIEGIGRLW